MRYASKDDRRLRERAITGLTDLADAGHRTVEIRQVLGWLGVEWREAEPASPDRQVPPGVDPMTGCAPVVHRG